MLSVKTLTLQLIVPVYIEVQSPSAAAVFVLGSSQNGWTEWVNSDNKSLSEVYRIEDN